MCSFAELFPCPVVADIDSVHQTAAAVCLQLVQARVSQLGTARVHQGSRQGVCGGDSGQHIYEAVVGWFEVQGQHSCAEQSEADL